MKPKDIPVHGRGRLAMLQSATEWDRRLEISDYELRKGGISYTVDSVRISGPVSRRRAVLDHRGRPAGAVAQVEGDRRAGKLIDFIYLERPKHPTKPHVEIDGLRCIARWPPDRDPAPASCGRGFRPAGRCIISVRRKLSLYRKAEAVSLTL